MQHLAPASSPLAAPRRADPAARWLRPVLVGLAALQLVQGLALVRTPSRFYDADPSWVGPFDAVTLGLGAAALFGLYRAAARDEVAR